MYEKIPLPVKALMSVLEEHNFEAFIVGGCVRDTLIGRVPKDWDITTNAQPEEIQALFPESFYENTFGTVGVKVARFLDTTPADKEEDIIEVTTYRSESNYQDSRHPESVEFCKTLEEDLSRRDFTINALAYGKRDNTWTLIDPYQGSLDLQNKTIRTVGDAKERFSEDALRLGHLAL